MNVHAIARKKEFRELQERLRMSVVDIAALLRRAKPTVYQYRAEGKHGRTPPESVLVILRAVWEERLQQNLAEAIAEIRSRGWDIDWTKLEEAQEDIDVHAAPFHRPGFLPTAA